LSDNKFYIRYKTLVKYNRGYFKIYKNDIMGKKIPLVI